ncbi:hypothetical protein G4B11_009223 [Aspergillus flavus]|nr:hypothetical protein G4B11_009223 [Aspergillus flavus]
MANLQSVREPRNREMKILILGLARTGTSSLTAALQQLGYSPYDWPDRCVLGHLPRWTEGLQAKYLSRGRPLEADEMDQLTSNFDAIIDTPCCLLVDELIAAYPTAKIILNYRDPDRWLESMQDTVFAVARWPFWRILAYTDPRYAGAIVQHHITLWDEIWGGDEGERCREKFVEHYNYVRKVVPPRRLLEYQVQEGWGPLCRFLEVEEPKEPFPVVHTGSQFMRTAARGWWDCVGRSIRNVTAAAVCLWILVLLSALLQGDNTYQKFVTSDDHAASLSGYTQHAPLDICPLNEEVVLPEMQMQMNEFLEDGSSYSFYDTHDIGTWNAAESQKPQFVGGYDGHLQQSPSVASMQNLSFFESEMAPRDFDSSNASLPCSRSNSRSRLTGGSLSTPTSISSDCGMDPLQRWRLCVRAQAEERNPSPAFRVALVALQAQLHRPDRRDRSAAEARYPNLEAERKDHLVQHLRGFHNLKILPTIENWKVEPPLVTSRCGFCDEKLPSWQARADHLASHFRQGLTMSDWKGDHCFEPAIAAQIKNAFPPYLLASEAKSMVPFSATDPATLDHLSQIYQRNGEIYSEHQLDAINSEGDPSFDLTPTSYLRWMTFRLGRFAQQSIANGIFPTDKMFQDESRRLVYGDKDAWEQTVADNNEWLTAFRRQCLPDLSGVTDALQYSST